MEGLLQLLFNGLSVGAVYALFALGYTLVFSVLGVINFAQGALFSVGGYLTFLLMGGKIGVSYHFSGINWRMICSAASSAEGIRVRMLR